MYIIWLIIQILHAFPPKGQVWKQGLKALIAFNGIGNTKNDKKSLSNGGKRLFVPGLVYDDISF